MLERGQFALERVAALFPFFHRLHERRGFPTSQDRRGQPVQFTAQRQMFIYFGMPRSTCSMVGVVTYALGGDIVKWLQKPVDGAKLGEL